MAKENWLPIKGYEGLYLVSDKGRVKTLHERFSYCRDNDNILSAQLCNNGYYMVALCKDGKVKRYSVHRLVATAFVPNPHPKKYKYVNHIDENKLNNNAENLEWCTMLQNINHSHGLEKMHAGSIRHNSKPVAIYKDGELVKTFSSATEAAKYIGDFQQNVSSCCYGKAKQVKGYQCKFINN